MKISNAEEVRTLPLFRDASGEVLERLLRGAYVQNFPPQIELCQEGDAADFLHVVLGGAVELYASWNRRETSLAVVRPVSTFILAATINDAPYLMSARTIEKSRLVLLPSEDVRAVFAEDNGFARTIVAELARCYRGVVKNTKNLKLRTSQERLANYLWRLQAAAEGAPSFELPLEKRRLASLLGMTPENLSRAIKALSAYGVEVDGNRVTIRQPKDLERFAKPSPLIDDPKK